MGSRRPVDTRPSGSHTHDNSVPPWVNAPPAPAHGATGWAAPTPAPVNFGGSIDNTINSIAVDNHDNDDDWKVVVRRARSRTDMRRAKGNGGIGVRGDISIWTVISLRGR